MAKALESPLMGISNTTTLPVTIADPVNIEFPGPSYVLEAAFNSTPGTPQTVITAVPPIGETWKLRRVEVVSRGYSKFTVYKDAVIIKQGKTSPSETTVSLPFEPWIAAVNPNSISLVYDQTDNPTVDVTAKLFYTKE